MIMSCVVNSDSPEREMIMSCVVNSDSPEREIIMSCVVNSDSPEREIIMSCAVNSDSPEREIIMSCAVNSDSPEREIIMSCAVITYTDPTLDSVMVGTIIIIIMDQWIYFMSNMEDTGRYIIIYIIILVERKVILIKSKQVIRCMINSIHTRNRGNILNTSISV